MPRTLLVRALSAGILCCVLTLACGGGDSVAPRVPAGIVMVPNMPVVPQGLSLQLTATVVDASGRAIRDKHPVFSSSDPATLTVSASGLLQSVGALGTVRITADLNGLTAFVDATVSQRIVGLSASPDSLVLNRYLSQPLVVKLKDFAGNEVPPVGLVAFTSGNTSIATVDANGVVTAKGVDGKDTITVTVDTFSLAVPVRVTQIPTAMSTSPINVVMQPGASRQIGVSVTDAHGDPIVNPQLGFQSSAPAVFSVSPTGLVTSLGPAGSGTATITCATLIHQVGVYVGTTAPGVVVETTPLDGAPYAAAIFGAGAMAVTRPGGSSVSLGALPGFTFPTTLPTGSNTFGVAINHAGTRAYVAYDGGLAVVDLAAKSVLPSIQVPGGGTKISVVISADDQTAYLGSNTYVYAIDLTTGQPTDSVATYVALTMALNPVQPRLYVGEDATGSVQEIDLTTMTEARVFPTGGAKGIGVSPNGLELYAVGEGGPLQVVDLASGQVTQSVSLQGQGFGLAVSSKFIVVAEALSGKVEIFDRASRVPLGTVAAGGTPRRPAIDAGETTVVVPNEGGWVDFIQ